jgi:hypothetical protein
MALSSTLMEAAIAGIRPRLRRQAPSHVDPVCKPVPLPDSSPRVLRTGPVIDPTLFKGVCVCVQSEDPMEVQHISRALWLVGAVVRSSGDESVQIVVSPHRIPAPPSRSRGCRLVRSVSPATRPVCNVLISQIPWVPSVLRANEDLQRTNQVNRIVVADARGGVPPSFLDISDMPQLHFDPVPKGYFRSPFDAVLSTAEAFVAAYEERISRPPAVAPGPPDRGHCDLCEVNYVSADFHR